jgi:hypothetical protein
MATGNITLTESLILDSRAFCTYLNNIIKHNTGRNVSHDEYDNFINKLKKIDKYYARVNIYADCNIFIGLVTMRTPTTTQMDGILIFLKMHTKENFNWIETVKKNGYEFTPNQEIKLLKCGYINYDCQELKSKDKSINKKYILSIFSKFAYDELCALITNKHNDYCKQIKKIIVFDSDYYDLFHDLFHDLNKNKIKYEPAHNAKVDTFYEIIFSLGYMRDIYGMSKLIDSKIKFHMMLYETDLIYDNHMLKFINDNIYPTNEQIIAYFKNSSLMNYGHNKYVILNKIIDNNVNLDPNIINFVIKLIDETNTYTGECLRDKQFMDMILKNNNKNSDDYKKIFDKMVSKGFIPTHESLLFSCKTQNEILFDYCIENNICPSVECLYETCKNTTNILLQKLMNMKFIVNEKCLDECLSCVNPSHAVINTIINEGIQILDIHLEYMLLNKIQIPSKCNPRDDVLFKICHVHNLIASKYVSPVMEKSKQLKLYKMVLDKTKKITFELVKTFMEKEKIEFNSYCYDIILIKHHANVIFSTKDGTSENKLFSEALCGAISKNKYTVTLEAISRCDDRSTRFKLLKHYGFVKNDDVIHMDSNNIALT